MAKNLIINGVTYSSVPRIQVPLSDESGQAIFYDTSDATAAASNVMSGYSVYGASGKIEGSLSTPTISQDSVTKVLTIS